MGQHDPLVGSLDPNRFAELLLEGLRDADDTREADFDPSAFQIRFREAGEPGAVVSLRNLYGEFCAAAEGDRAAVLRDTVRALLSYQKPVPDEFEDARHDLLPAVRTRWYFEQLALRSLLNGERATRIPHQPVGAHLAAGVVYDLPEAMQTISQKTLDRWGVEFPEALEAARCNLEQREFTCTRIDRRVYASTTGDNYDASRLLVPELAEALELEGAPVALVPNRDTLLIAGSDDDVGLAMIAELAERALDAPRPMNGIPLRLEGGAWVSWMPEAGRPIHTLYRLLELKTLYAEYADQKALLDELYAKQGCGPYVATFSAFQKQDTGDVVSYCVWSEGVDALLPRAEKLYFFREDEECVAAAWERVEEVAGGLLIPTDLYPPRYRVLEFPSREQLDALGTEAG